MKRNCSHTTNEWCPIL